MMMNFRWIYLILLVGWPALILAQPVVEQPEAGSPLYRYFGTADYKSNAQNFAVVRGQAGIMYFANLAGILEFDGKNWRTISTSNVSRVTSLLVDKRKRIWVGANGEFGYLSPDSTGQLAFRNVSSGIGKSVGYIRAIAESKNGVSLVSSDAIYLVAEGKIRVKQLDEPIEAAFSSGSRIFLFGKKSRRLIKWDGVSITPLHYELSNTGVPLDITGAIALSGDSTLILTSNQGVFQCVGQTLRSLNWKLNGYRITSGAPLPNGNIALATHHSGVVVVGSDGQILQRGIGQSLLQDNAANALFHDGSQNLWLALNDGLAMYNWPSPISLFDKENGLKGEVTSMLRFNGRLYVGTLNGLFTIDDNKAIPVPGVRSGCLSLKACGNSLLVATSNGLLELKSGSVRTVTSEFILSVACPGGKGNLAFVGLTNGFGKVSLNGGASVQVIPAVRSQVSDIVDNGQGYLWLETLTDGIYRYDVANDRVKQYTAREGLPSNQYSRLSLIGNEVWVATQKGTYRYNAASDRWVPQQISGGKGQQKALWVDRIIGDNAGDVWATGGDKKGVSWYPSRDSKENKVFREVSLSLLSQVPFGRLYADMDGTLWAGGPQGLYRIDPRVGGQYGAKPVTLVSKIVTPDGTVFGGLSGKLIELRKSMKSSGNKVVIDYVAPSYHINETVQYQYLLEDQDQHWSEWTSLTQKEYSGLPPGSYLFKVRARDIYGNVSSEAQVGFSIEKPWYTEWWMITLYLVALGLLIHRIVLWRLRRVVEEKQNLEKLINERTEEIEDRKQDLEQQSEVLSATNDQLERIDSFVKAINNEINTHSLFRMVLSRLCQFQNVDTSSALMWDKNASLYRFVGIAGVVDFSQVEQITLTEEEAQNRYVNGAREIFEDIFLQNNFREQTANHSISTALAPKSLVAIAIRTEGSIRSIITLENMSQSEAFSERDYQLFRGMKEHLAGAYIKTSILDNLEETLHNLQSTQEALIRQEKLASVGQLTKGIVDRILNPLNYINNFAQSSTFLVNDIRDVTDKEGLNVTQEEGEDLADALQMLQSNLGKIYEHGNSTTRIVKDMQKLLKGKSDQFLSVEIGSFLETRVRSIFQDIQSANKQSNAELIYESGVENAKVLILPFELAEVLQNLISNSFYAILERIKTEPQVKPVLSVKAQNAGEEIQIRIRDNGKGIPAKEMEQLFSPFFTTKPTSKGTGLGLYMSKDIIEYHKGRIGIQSSEGEFTEVTIHLPKDKTE